MQLHFLVPLSVPMPPMLEQALGYNGQARLVAYDPESQQGATIVEQPIEALVRETLREKEGKR